MLLNKMLLNKCINKHYNCKATLHIKVADVKEMNGVNLLVIIIRITKLVIVSITHTTDVPPEKHLVGRASCV